MTTFVTRDEMAELTGARTRAGQIRWLRERGWVWEPNAAGWPVVLRAHMESRMGGKPNTVESAGPNWRALRAA